MVASQLAARRQAAGGRLQLAEDLAAAEVETE